MLSRKVTYSGHLHDDGDRVVSQRAAYCKHIDLEIFQSLVDFSTGEPLLPNSWREFKIFELPPLPSSSNSSKSISRRSSASTSIMRLNISASAMRHCKKAGI